MTTIQIVDDSDPAVSYSSGWQKAGGSNEYNLTTSWSNQPGTTATLTFVGVQISVVGTIGPRTPGYVSPQSNYTVDNSSPNVYTADQDPATVHYNTRFYLSPTFPYGQHTLIVTNLLNSDSFFIDYFLIFKSNTDTSFSPTVVTVTRTSTAGIAANQTSAVIGKSTHSSSNSNTGTIVGSALGAAILIIVAVAFILWLQRRKKRNRDELVVIDSTYDRQEPALSYTHFSSDAPTITIAQPTTPISAQSYGTRQSQNVDGALPPPPVYTSDVSQPIHPVQGIPPSKLINLSYNPSSGNTVTSS